MSTYQNKWSIKVSFINEYKFDIVVTFFFQETDKIITLMTRIVLLVAWTNTFTLAQLSIFTERN